MPIESGATSVSSCPTFSLPDLSGDVRTVRAPFNRPVLIAFTCNHCPYVQWVEQGLGQFALEGDLDVYAICSNDIDTYPDDDVPGLRQQVARARWNFPYLIDANQHVARAFGAVCTPDFFLFSSSGDLIYRGAMDESRPQSDKPVTAEYLVAALESAIDKTAAPAGRPSMGCGIKWKPQQPAAHGNAE